MASVKEETARGVKWGFIQKCTLQPVQFIFGIILARLISPEEMGVLGLTGIFFAIAGQLQQCGFGSALIRKQERTDEDICTVFWFNVAMSFLLSLTLFLAAPWFVTFFNQPALLNLTRVSALLMFLGSTGSVHWTLYSARREFRTPALISMSTTIVAMPFTIWAAYAGWSYWAPMLQGIISSTLSLMAVWVVSPWKPSFKFSRESFREFFKFGINLTLTGLLNTAYQNLRTFIIGKFYTPAQLAFYQRGEHTCSMPLTLIDSILAPVIFPILATLQKDKTQLYAVYQKYIQIIAVIVQWIMITLAANSSAIIVLLYGERWAEAAIYAQLLCFGWMLNPLLSANSGICSVLGRTDLILKLEIVLRAVSIAAMIGCAFISVKAICYAAILSAVIAFAGSSLNVTRISEIRFTQILRCYLPYLAFSMIANIPAYLMSFTSYHPIVQILVGGCCSCGIYVIILCWRRDSAGLMLYSYARESVRKKLRRA